MIYSIRLTITHAYDQPAANSRHIIRVLPRRLEGRQHVTLYTLSVYPQTDTRSEGTDFFGTATLDCAHLAPHAQMSIELSCQVQMAAPTPWLDMSPDLPALRAQWEACRDLGADAPVHFLGPTPRLSADNEIRDFAQGLADPATSAAQTVIRLGKAIHDAMTFDNTATTVDTDAAEAFALRRGVCQDFSHIMILGLHALGIPACYVSGYLRTLPPPGGVKLAGADAMHAWVRAWCGTAQGWVEYDPTNATLVGTDHIVVGYGRDYADVSPMRGHLRASGGQRNTQAVDVTVLR
jgi:transglutaminase-like putative cysteine protease